MAPSDLVHYVPEKAPRSPAHIRNPGRKHISYVHSVSEKAPRSPAHIRNPGRKRISYVHSVPEKAPRSPAHIRNPGRRHISYVHYVPEKAPRSPAHIRNYKDKALVNSKKRGLPRNSRFETAPFLSARLIGLAFWRRFMLKCRITA